MDVLDEKDLQAISQLMDAKINDLESRMTARIDQMDAKIDSTESRLTASISKLDTKIEDTESRLTAGISKLDTKIEDTESRVLAYIEAAVMPKFDILAEGHQLLRETLAPKDRVEALEDDMSFMKQVIKSMSRDIEALKKAQ